MSGGDDHKAFKWISAESVVTPAGTLDKCAKVEVHEGSRTLYIWIAPSVGLVKRENPTSGTVEQLVSLVRP